MDEDERIIAERAGEIEAALEAAGLDVEVFYDEDGSDPIGYHITIGAGEERYLPRGGMARRLTLAYWTRDDTWYWQSLSKGGREDGPWTEPSLDGGRATVAAVVELVKRQMAATP